MLSYVLGDRERSLSDSGIGLCRLYYVEEDNEQLRNALGSLRKEKRRVETELDEEQNLDKPVTVKTCQLANRRLVQLLLNVWK